MVKQLIDQYGNPISSADLSREIAAPQEFGQRRVIEDTVATGLTPEYLAQILREAATGHPRKYLTLAEEMEERYLHYASQVQTRRLAIAGVERTVSIPDGVPTKIADAVIEMVEGRVLRHVMAEATDGIAKGYSVSEVLWEYEHKALRPVEFKRRDQRFFTFDRRTHEEIRLLNDMSLQGERLQYAKFVRHVPLSKAGLPIRRGFARAAAWAYLIQSFGLKDWVAFSEIYGVPFRLGRYGKNASDADKRSLLAAVRALANDAAAIVPEGSSIEFAKVEGSHGGDVFEKLLEYMDKQVSKLVLGQTMTSDNGSSMAQAKVHNEVRLDILESDAEDLAETINRDVIEPFVAMNFGPQENYPTMELTVAKPEDIKGLTDAVSKLVPLGFRVGQREMRDRLGISDPGTDEEILVAPKAAAPAPEDESEGNDPDPASNLNIDPAGHANSCSCSACKASVLAPSLAQLDDVDELIEDVLDEWQDVTDPLLAPLRQVLSEATTLESALAMLGRKGPDGGALLDALAIGTARARGLGDLTD
ncbi:MAG: DUF935 domain-containing protein [Pseudomonadota bacterium]